MVTENKGKSLNLLTAGKFMSYSIKPIMAVTVTAWMKGIERHVHKFIFRKGSNVRKHVV